MRTKVIGVAGGLAVLLAAFGGYSYYKATQFAASYEAYAAAADVHNNAAFTPGARNNPLRQELNSTLARALSDKSLSNAERLALAQRGLTLLDDFEKQIDAIGEAGREVESAIAAMEEDAFWPGKSDITSLAHERFRVIADIRGLSYRANYHTAEIFKHLIKDGGKLTDAYVRELNDQVPLVEEQFDRRSNLYNELESANYRMEKKSAELGVF